MTDMKPKIIVFKESRMESLLSDLQTVGIVLIAFALNYYFVDGNNWIDGILTVLIVISLLSQGTRSKNEFYSVDEVIKFLRDDES